MIVSVVESLGRCITYERGTVVHTARIFPHINPESWSFFKERARGENLKEIPSKWIAHPNRAAAISSCQRNFFVSGSASAIYTWKVAWQYGICWFKKELSWRLGTLRIFFRNNIKGTFFLLGKKVAWMSWNSVWFEEDSENFSCLPLTNKKVLFRKNTWSVPSLKDSSFWNQRTPLDVTTFLIHGFGIGHNFLAKEFLPI